MIILGVILAISIIIVMIAPGVAARRVLGRREGLSDEKLLELFRSSSRLPAETILMILKSIGSGYGIGYSKLRPADCFGSQLSKIDSWRFDAGAEKTEELLREKFGLAMPVEPKSFTISDLLKLIADKTERDETGSCVKPDKRVRF